MVTQAKLKKLCKDLEDFKIPLVANSSSIDSLKRLNLYLPMFVLMEFAQDTADYQQAWDFNNHIHANSQKRGLSTHLLVKEGLANILPVIGSKGGYRFNQFVMDNLDTLIKYVDYLLLGNGVLEGTFPDRAMEGASMIAKATIAEQLERTLHITYQR